MAAIHKESYTGKANARKGASNLFSVCVYGFDLLFGKMNRTRERGSEKKCFVVGINTENCIESRKKRDNFGKKNQKKINKQVK